MLEAIRSNKKRSRRLLFLMGVILVIFGVVLGKLVEPGGGGLVGGFLAIFLWLILYVTAVSVGDKLILASMGAKKLKKADMPQLWNVLEEMTIASGLKKMPDLYLIDDPSPNAFAVGRKEENAAVAVTSGLLRRLNRDELQGVVAHEIAHIKNQDIRFMTLATVTLGAIVIISDSLMRMLFFWRPRRPSLFLFPKRGRPGTIDPDRGGDPHGNPGSHRRPIALPGLFP